MDMMKHVEQSRTDRPDEKKNNYADEIKFWLSLLHSSFGLL